MENQEISISEAGSILEKIKSVKIFDFKNTNQMTLFFECPTIPIFNDVIKIITFNRIEVDFSINETGQYFVILVFIDQRGISFPIATKWTNETYYDINLLVNQKRIKKINAFCIENPGFPIFPYTNEIEFIRYHPKNA